MKNHQRELASTRFSLFLLRTAPPLLSHAWFKIIQPVSVRCRGIYKGALLFFFFLKPDSWGPGDNAARISPLFTWSRWHKPLSCCLRVNHSCWWSCSMFSLGVHTPNVNITCLQVAELEAHGGQGPSDLLKDELSQSLEELEALLKAKDEVGTSCRWSQRWEGSSVHHGGRCLIRPLKLGVYLWFFSRKSTFYKARKPIITRWNTRGTRPSTDYGWDVRLWQQCGMFLEILSMSVG